MCLEQRSKMGSSEKLTPCTSKLLYDSLFRDKCSLWKFLIFYCTPLYYPLVLVSFSIPHKCCLKRLFKKKCVPLPLMFIQATAIPIIFKPITNLTCSRQSFLNVPHHMTFSLISIPVSGITLLRTPL